MSFLKKTVRSVLADSLICAAVLFILSQLLKLFGLAFRAIVAETCVLLIAAGIIIGIFQLIFKIRRTAVRVIVLVLTCILLIVSTPYAFLFAAFAHVPEHVVERDGHKYVAEVRGFIGTDVKYYDSRGPLLRGTQLKIYEDYGKGGFDPIDNRYGYEYTPVSVRYYDDAGNIVYSKNLNQ